MAFHLLTGLRKLPGLELFVIILNQGPLADRLERAGVPTCVLDEGEHSVLGIAAIAARKLRTWVPDVLHSHRYKENCMAFLVSLMLKNTAALVGTQHGLPESYGRHPSLLRRLKLYADQRLLASKFDKTIAVSADIRRSLVRLHSYDAGRIETIHNGIVIPDVPDRIQGKHVSIVGSAGRFVPVKDFLLMVEVARDLCARDPRTVFELAGDGPMLKDIQALVASYALQKRVRFRGFVTDVSAFYGGLDVYLNTSLHEGLPLSVLEAMAHGVPPVVPRVGGLEEIVTDGVDGYLVDSRNPGDFADRCASLRDDENLRLKMGRAARKKVIEMFSVERMVQNYFDMYLRTIKKSGHG